MALGVGSCVHSSLDSQDLTELEVSGSRKFLLAVASPSSPPPAMPRVSLVGWSASVVIYHFLSLRQIFPSGASGKDRAPHPSCLGLTEQVRSGLPADMTP